MLCPNCPPPPIPLVKLSCKCQPAAFILLDVVKAHDLVVVLVQTLALVASQVSAMKLNAFYQLSIMLTVLLVGHTILAHCQPFEAIVSQRPQV